MEPKFQSSFIPKNQSNATVSPLSMRSVHTKTPVLYYLSLLIFILSVLFALGTFGYNFYLKSRISQMGSELDQALTTIQPEPASIREMIRFDSRIGATKELLAQHKALSPLFDFLETSTPKTVRFNDFQYSLDNQGLSLSLKGEARGYVALAAEADIFNSNPSFKNTVFTDFNLNDKGDVTFSVKTNIDPAFLSYESKMKDVVMPPREVATSTVETGLPPTTTP